MTGFNFNSLIIERIGTKFNNQKLKKYFDFLFIYVEKVFVKLSKLLAKYVNFYNKMVDNEISLADISKDDKVLHIGCGPIPATDIIIAQKTGAKVLGIDHNHYSIKQANDCINQLNLSDKVEVKHAEASDFSVKDFDVIIISQGIRPCDTVLHKISESMKPDARVIFRSSSNEIGEISEDDIFIKEIFSISKKIAQKQNGLLLSILLKNK